MSSEKYIAAAYAVVFVCVLVYVVIMALKLGRLEREVDELARGASEERVAHEAEREKAPVG